VKLRGGATAAGLVAVLALGGCAGATAPGTGPRGGGWLDRPLAPWNLSGAPVPPPPEVPPHQAENRERCRDGIRPPVNAADRAVTAAGWWLSGHPHTLGEVSVVVAALDWDGMCRPLSYQVFAFVGDRFAGTLSPVLMDARTDGAWQAARIVSPFRLAAEFLRYTRHDALCCPSRVSEVAYRIEDAAGGPMLVPIDVLTRPLPR
jgi:LppP/LprE lipoprotein